MNPNHTRCAEGDAMGILFLVFIAFILLAGGCWGVPRWHVYQQEKSGEAALAKANSDRHIAVLEANAKEEAAKSLANAEVIRAGGVAQANKIIGDSLKGNESYLRYLWIQNLGEGKNEVIYVPTEANLPLLEAGRLHVEPGRTTP